MVPVGLSQRVLAAQEDVQEGCEGAVEALKGWIAALAVRDFDYLEKHLSEDFVFTGPPIESGGGKVIGGVKNKTEFIEIDRHIYNADIQLLSLTARRLGDLVITLVFARVSEEFRGDLGPDMPTADELTEMMTNVVFGYTTSWRHIDGIWQSTSHHILGQVDGI